MSLRRACETFFNGTRQFLEGEALLALLLPGSGDASLFRPTMRQSAYVSNDSSFVHDKDTIGLVHIVFQGGLDESHSRFVDRQRAFKRPDPGIGS